MVWTGRKGGGGGSNEEPAGVGLGDGRSWGRTIPLPAARSVPAAGCPTAAFHQTHDDPHRRVCVRSLPNKFVARKQNHRCCPGNHASPPPNAGLYGKRVRPWSVVSRETVSPIAATRHQPLRRPELWQLSSGMMVNPRRGIRRAGLKALRLSRSVGKRPTRGGSDLSPCLSVVRHSPRGRPRVRES